MIDKTKEFLIKKYNINSKLFELYEKALEDVKPQFEKLDEIREYNQLKVLNALQEERIVICILLILLGMDMET